MTLDEIIKKAEELADGNKLIASLAIGVSLKVISEALAKDPSLAEKMKNPDFAAGAVTGISMGSAIANQIQALVNEAEAEAD